MTDELRTRLAERMDQVWEVRLGFECVARQLEQNAVVDEVARALVHTALRFSEVAYVLIARALVDAEPS